MKTAEAQKVLDELQGVRPEVLTGEAKRLFEAIMKIADERDKLKKHNYDLLRKLKNRVKEVKKLEKYSIYKKEFSTLNKKIKEKDKAIDLMAETISCIDTDIKVIKKQIKEKYCDFLKSDADCCWKTDVECRDCIKQYFENKAKEYLKER